MPPPGNYVANHAVRTLAAPRLGSRAAFGCCAGPWRLDRALPRCLLGPADCLRDSRDRDQPLVVERLEDLTPIPVEASWFAATFLPATQRLVAHSEFGELCRVVVFVDVFSLETELPAGGVPMELASTIRHASKSHLP